MFRCLLGAVLALATAAAVAAAPSAAARRAALAQAVTITRDDFGIAHVHGRDDAAAVFGMIYAQAEDDFPRIEANYLAALGRTAEAEGEAAIWRDLRQRLWVDPATLQKQYAASPCWLRRLMDAWADGLNHYLATHPTVQPRVLAHFEPWMALAFTEGSIGGDIERVDLTALAAFHGGHPPALATRTPPSWAEPTGSNGIAIAPALTVDGRALLLINPHTSFYFRTELQMQSDTGLDAYGAVTWGQFFVYQGFNRDIGWMHTSTGLDAVDEFAESVELAGAGFVYRYGNARRPVRERGIDIHYRRPDGTLASRHFTAYFTHHGPITRRADGKWIATALMDRPVAALEQSWLRTRAHDLAGFLKVAKLQANSSNNTLFASRQGEIAFLMPQFVPRRDDRFDYTHPVDGSDPATDWHGLIPLAELPQVLNPPNGWVMNTNDWPWSAAGGHSPKAADFPRYMDSFGENPRGRHATELLTGASGFSLPKLIAAAFDNRQPAFERLVPRLVHDFDVLPASDARKARLAGPVALLRDWDGRWGSASMPNTLATFWGDTLWDRTHASATQAGVSTWDFMARDDQAAARLAALDTAVIRLEQDFGSWGVAWGEVNRFQRLDGAITPHFDDAAPSIPVPFGSARWGSLASFGAHRWPGTRKYYGSSGNSFVAVVAFGPRVEARAISAGGASGDPASAHFRDQAERYASGDLRAVRFYPEDIAAHAVRRYHPGE